METNDNFSFDLLQDALVDFEDGHLQYAVTQYLNKYVCMVRYHDNGPLFIERYYDASKKQYNYVTRRRRGMEECFNHCRLRWEVQDGERVRMVEKTVFDIWDKHPSKLVFDRIVFEPCIDVPGCLNIWTGYKTTREECAQYANYSYTDETGHIWNVNSVLAHLYTYWAAGNEENYLYILKWLASAVQNPGKKLGVALLLVSDEGTGKDLLSCPLFEMLYGSHFMRTMRIEDVAGRFANFERVVTLVLDEIDYIDKTQAAVMKAVITDPVSRVEKKGIQTYYVENFANVLIFTNNPQEHIVDIGPNQRRYAMFSMDSSIVRASNKRSYFNGLAEFLGINDKTYRGLKAYAHYLFNLDVSQFEAKDFPVSEFMALQKRCSMPAPHAWWDECLQRGYIPARDVQILDPAIVECNVPLSAVSATELYPETLYECYMSWCVKNQLRKRGRQSMALFYKDLKNVAKVSRMRNGSGRELTRLPKLCECRHIMGSFYSGCKYDENSTWSIKDELEANREELRKLGQRRRQLQILKQQAELERQRNHQSTLSNSCSNVQTSMLCYTENARARPQLPAALSVDVNRDIEVEDLDLDLDLEYDNANGAYVDDFIVRRQ
jgi:hypothetical protein